MIDLHQAGLGLFIFFSIVSLVLVVSKPVAKEFEATALRWIRAFRRIQAEWHKPLPLTIDKASEPAQLVDQTSINRHNHSISNS